MDLTNPLLSEMAASNAPVLRGASRGVAVEGFIPGTVRTSIGHEGAVVGACMAVRSNDMTGYHRSHGHPIAKAAAFVFQVVCLRVLQRQGVR